MLGTGTRRMALALALLGGLVACQQPPVTQDQFYRLTIGAVAQPAAAPKLAGTLEVERLAADGLTAGRPIVYSEAGNDTTLKEYNYHFWVEPPPVMLRDQLAAYLRAARTATTVVTPDMRANADYVAGGRILRFERVVGARSAAVVELELWLRRARDNRLMVLQNYRVEIAAEKDSVTDAVNAMNRAVGTIFARFSEDIAKT